MDIINIPANKEYNTKNLIMRDSTIYINKPKH